MSGRINLKGPRLQCCNAVQLCGGGAGSPARKLTGCHCWLCCAVLCCCPCRRFFESLYAALTAVLHEAFDRLQRRPWVEQELGQLFRWGR